MGLVFHARKFRTTKVYCVEKMELKSYPADSFFIVLLLGLSIKQTFIALNHPISVLNVNDVQFQYCLLYCVIVYNIKQRM